MPSLRALAMLILLASGSARADSADTLIERARAHHQAGQRLYELGDYPAALHEFQAGYELAPRPEFLLNLGQVHRMLKDPVAAIHVFEKFLASVPAGDTRRLAVEDVLRTLCAEAASRRASAPAPTPPAAAASEVPAPAAAPAIAVTKAPPRRWYRDPAGGALTGIGLAGIAVGAGLFGHANAVVGDALVDLEHFERAQGATVMRTAGLVVLGAGGALVLGGVIRYATVRR